MCSVHLESVVLHPRNAAREMVKVVNPGTRCRPNSSDVLSRFLPTEPLYLYGAVGTRQLQRLLSPGSGGDDETNVLGQIGQSHTKSCTNDGSTGFLSCAARTELSAASTSDHDQGVRDCWAASARAACFKRFAKQARVVRSMMIGSAPAAVLSRGRELIRQLDEGVPRAMAQRAGVQVSTATVAVVLQHDGPRGEGRLDFLQGGRLAHPSAAVQREVLDFRSEQC